jgi:hypothetical protein
VSLDAHTTNNLPVSHTRLIFQEEIMLEEGKVGVYGKKILAQVNKDDDLED